LPLCGQAFELHLVGELIYKAYIDITLMLLAQFGVDIINEDYRVFKIPAGSKYHAHEHLYVEGDAYSASYFLGAGLI
ncbi:3-phosphoshikimate 1-carboxyvinyltransferase, partial [Neisseria sp. P0015.S002]